MILPSSVVLATSFCGPGILLRLPGLRPFVADRITLNCRISRIVLQSQLNCSVKSIELRGNLN
jgi:hypothetical protein